MTYADTLQHAAYAINRLELNIQRLAENYDRFLEARDSGNAVRVAFQTHQLENAIRAVIGLPEDYQDCPVTLEQYLAEMA